MTDYYVDIGSPGAWNANTGQDHTGNQWLGVSGLQYAFDTVTAGNTIYVKGSGDADKLKGLACDNQSGNFVRGEGVTWDGGTSTGVVSEIVANLPTVIEVITGTLADNDNLTGTTSGATADVAGNPSILDNSIDVDTNNGDTVNGYIYCIGVNASWSNDETRAILDMNSVQVHGFYISSDYIYFENIEGTAVGINHYPLRGNTAYRGIYVNCCASNSAFHGFYISSHNYSVFIRCCAYGNGGDGFASGSIGQRFLFCSSHDNTRSGWELDDPYITYIGCLSYDNDDDGFGTIKDQQLLFNCVANGNGNDGMVIGDNDIPAIYGCRITNNVGVGLECNSYCMLYGWNYFEDNGTNIANSTLAVNILSSNESEHADTNEGYTNKGDGTEDFNLRSDATLKREAITIPTS